ncbi:DHA2 family efflux MFS transporter permease subunit [Nocardioides pantholopis]|uniref:DHA2 family efflux MFS transporter permease subunit n=1 Tax=Nocardioides pantholopis TaxID=2483798 RepID=UPI000FD8E8B6|nr:DHA2 family efflux MFS transporter permease subunit [Nocardioides pantholopis]
MTTAPPALDVRARTIGLVLALGGLMVTVDTTVAFVAVPAIVADLDSTLPAVQWVTSGYLLGVVAVVPVAGWAAARYGARRVYLLALGVFTGSSVLAGLAGDAGSLTAFRILQGLGGGLLNPVGQAIALRAVPREVRGRMMGLLGLPVLIGPVLGPLLAGWLVDTASWRWIFLINLPIGAAAILLCARLLPTQHADRPTADQHQAARIDWAGLVLVCGGAVLLVLGCTLVGESGSVTGRTGAALGAGLLLLVGFGARTVRTDAPLVDLRLLRHPPLAAGLGVLGCFGAGYFGAMTVLPVYVQGVRGDPASLAATITIPMALAVGLTMQVATRLVDRVPPRRIVLSGVTLGLLGTLALLLATTSGASYPLIAAAGAVLGVGSGATLIPTMAVAVRDLENDDTARGTTLLALVQQLAGAVGGAVIASSLTLLVAERVPALATAERDGLAAMLALDPRSRARLEDSLALAVGGSYAVAAGFVALSMLAALVGLAARPNEDRTQTRGQRRTIRSR